MAWQEVEFWVFRKRALSPLQHSRTTLRICDVRICWKVACKKCIRSFFANKNCIKFSNEFHKIKHYWLEMAQNVSGSFLQKNRSNSSVKYHAESWGLISESSANGDNNCRIVYRVWREASGEWWHGAIRRVCVRVRGGGRSVVLACAALHTQCDELFQPFPFDSCFTKYSLQIDFMETWVQRIVHGVAPDALERSQQAVAEHWWVHCV